MSRLHGNVCRSARRSGWGRTAWFVAGLPVRFGQLGSLGHAALGYSEDDLACSPAVHRGQPTRRDRFQCHSGGLVVLIRCGQRQGQIEPGQGRAPGPGPELGCFDRGEHLAGDAFGGRVPNQDSVVAT